MLRKPLKILFSILTVCTLLVGMMTMYPAQIVQAEGSILFDQTPIPSTDTTAKGYTSTSVPLGATNLTYEARDDFWGVSDKLISHVQWYGVAVKSPYWEAGSPEGMKFQITFYQKNASTFEFTQVAQFSDLSPTYQTYDGLFPFGASGSVQGYCFDVDLSSEVALTAGWISIQNTANATDGSTFQWINSHEGNNNCIQFGEFLGGEWDYASYQDDLAFTLTGTTPRDYTVTFQSGVNGSLTGPTTFTEIPSGTSWTSAVPELPTPVPAFGYEFDSWSPSFPTVVNADVTYTANFVKDQDPNHWFTVSFQEGQHGYLLGTRNYYDILSGTPWASAVTVPTPYGYAGYTFGSWSPTFPDSVNADGTFTANFVIDPNQTFYVFYDGYGNTGGTVPVDAKTYHSGDTVTVLGSDKLELTGFTFAGWATNYEGKELLWNPGSTFVGAADTTLYARWITIDENTATLSGTKSAKSGQKVTLTTSVSGVGSTKYIPPGDITFYCSTDPFSNNWTQLGSPIQPIRGKASLTVNTLTSPGTYYIYAWFIPDDWESEDDFFSNVWTVNIK